ncbi:MAG TPA: hypothetical protein VH120_20245, partial [Gemmataceae bacterium]|nr:hypothetical protein [Gemmataceae bacterium]
TPTTRRPAPNPAVQHPLDRLRGTIRRYVALEGLAVIGIYVALWFWLGLLFDFGVFKSLGLDWVQELPRGVRATLLVVLAGGLVAVLAVKIVRRLMVEFRPAALALVLERQFPAVLGDRLITAVELADLDRAAEQGYSRAMVEQTIRDAAERVATVPVSEVFNWRRLRVLWAWFAGLSVGLLILVAAVYSVATKTNPTHDFAVRFRDVAAIWTERNVLLQNTIWPRQAYLELLDFPASGDLRVGRDSPSPRLRVKAVRWLIADPKAAEGWRAARWDDLHADLAGGPAPELPAKLLDPTNDGSSGWTLDGIHLLLEQPDVRARLSAGMSADGYKALMALFEERLPAKAAEPGMGRRFRMLEVPERVEIVYWGAKTSNEMPLNLGHDQEYAGPLTDLRESVKFRVKARDYSTATRTITLVPPPMLTRLSRDEDRPAYLYHRPPLDGGPAALKGLKQHVADLGVSLSGTVSQFAVPAGTDIELVGEVDKELDRAALRPRPAGREKAAEATPLALADDHHGFRVRFPALAAEQDFDLELTDTDNVTSRRHVRIEAVKDGPPRVNVLIEGIRKASQGYVVTPVALIPFVGTVVDNSGIDKVDYSVTVQRIETAATAGAQAATAVGAITQFAGLDTAGLITGTIAAGEVNRLLAAGPEPKPVAFPLRSFEEIIAERKLKDVLLAELQQRLKQPPSDRPVLVPQFEVKPQFEGLDLRDRLPDLKVKEESQIQPRYRLRVTVQATDNNVETGPGVGPNKEPPFTVLVVSELELLVEIAKDEQNLHFKMEDTVGRLRDARLRLGKLAEELPALPDAQMQTMAIRAQEVQETTNKARDVVQEVLTDYSRLLREMELNRVMPKLVERVKGDIVFPLEGATRQEFVKAEEAQDGYHKTLESGRKPDAAATQQAQQTLDQLIDKLARVMDAMGEVTTVNKLITKLREIEKGQEEDIARVLKKLQEEQRKKIEAALDQLDKLDK